MFGKMLEWFKRPVARVPEDVAVCEFECDKLECRLEDWENCKRRLHGINLEKESHKH